jgi:S1-C subfamily serine protease
VLVRRLGEDKPGKGSRKGGDAAPRIAGEAPPGGGEPPQGEGAAPKAGDAKKFSLTGVGTGVVFSEDGMIFTNLHVVAGADDIGVTFADGTESAVELLDAQPENDLAVLRAKTLPDDLRPATLRSTRGLKTGDEVLAVGFPFGIGPTATWGVVSGLRREHYSEQGRRNLVDLIQFDAATNPGNSGGPLVTREGDVVGIVTSILNPTDESFFVGIAFAVPIENAAKAAGVSPF